MVRNLDTDHEGWMLLCRAMLHVRHSWAEHDAACQTNAMLDHCRRLILLEEYPEDENIVGLVAESVARMAKAAVL